MNYWIERKVFSNGTMHLTFMSHEGVQKKAYHSEVQDKSSYCSLIDGGELYVDGFETLLAAKKAFHDVMKSLFV